MQLDYVDVGMIHYVDDQKDFDNIFNGEIIKYAKELKEKYLQTALKHLDDIAVMSIRKKPLQELAEFMIQREY